MNTKQSPSQSVTRVTRALDAVDRAHARAASKLHGARITVLSAVEHGIDRLENALFGAIERARVGVHKADAASADAVNRAQGVVGQAIEKARETRSHREHITA